MATVAYAAAHGREGAAEAAASGREQRETQEKEATVNNYMQWNLYSGQAEVACE